MDKKLLKTIQLIPVFLSTVFTLVIITLLIINNRIELNHSISDLRAEFNERQKQQIKNRVDTIYQQVSYERERTESSLKASIKEKVYQAYNVVSTIYSENKDQPDAVVQRLIVAALKSVRFNDGRGYYFILDMQGKAIMIPHYPEQENINQWDAIDSKGTYVTREFISIAKNRGEGFNKWWFFKPDNHVEQREKIGFVKLFEPYGWVIGTGEYLDDFERSVKQDLLHWISTIRFGENGYMFVFNEQGVILAHQNNDLISQNYIDYPNKQDMQAFFQIAKHNGGYINYPSTYLPTNVKGPDKLSYVKWYPDWKWIIGTGVYVTAMEAYLAQKEHVIVKRNWDELVVIIVFSIALIAAVVALTYFLSKVISKRFSQFEFKIETSFVKLENANDAMQYMTLHDPLTGLPNRLSFDKFAQAHLDNLKGEWLAIVFVDIDNFKRVNDLYGHAMGDELLRAISWRFENILGKHDCVCRFGGDEFLFCFSNLNTKAELFANISKVKAIFDTKILCGTREIKSDCTIGVSVYPDDAQSINELISKADIALYKSKEKAKGAICLFDAAFDAQIKYRHVMEQELCKAVERDELEVRYQPQVNAKNKQIVSVEALCSWNSPVLGQADPVEFIPIAEQCGAVYELGLFVIKTACRDILALSPNGEGALGLSINVSPLQLIDTDFCADAIRIIASTGMDFSRIIFELTESAAIDRISDIAPSLHQLRLLGFGLSLDDFGTGFSSLSYLNDLPFSEIKIDRSFVAKFLNNYQSDSLIRSIIAIGESFDMTVVAEGIETQEQCHKLASYNCDLLQGYFFDRPLCLADLAQRINQGYLPDSTVLRIAYM
jgi:diguanylate cyclase (GGDEF)-like protein